MCVARQSSGLVHADRPVCFAVFSQSRPSEQDTAVATAALSELRLISAALARTEDELSEIPHFKRIKVIRNGEERLGAEVGCIFAEFGDKKSA